MRSSPMPSGSGRAVTSAPRSAWARRAPAASASRDSSSRRRAAFSPDTDSEVATGSTAASTAAITAGRVAWAFQPSSPAIARAAASPVPVGHRGPGGRQPP